MSRELFRQALNALVYHRQQTRPIHNTDLCVAALRSAIAQPQAEPYGHVTTHTVTGQQFFCRHPTPPYLDTAKECIAVYATPQQAQPAPAVPAVRPLTDERAAFEAWIRKDCGDLTTFGQGLNMHYRNSAVNNAWTGWQARAHGIAAPGTDNDCTPNHLCKGRMVHLPHGEQCDRCGHE